MSEPDPYAPVPITVPDALLDATAFTDLAAMTALVNAGRAAQAFRDAMDELLHSPGVSAEESREAAEGLLKLAAGAKSATVHIPAGVWPAHDEPFLQPDYIAAPVVGAPGEPIALWRREGGA